MTITIEKEGSFGEMEKFRVDNSSLKNILAGKAFIGGSGKDASGNCTADVVVFDDKSGEMTREVCGLSDEMAKIYLVHYNGFG